MKLILNDENQRKLLPIHLSLANISDGFTASKQKAVVLLFFCLWTLNKAISICSPHHRLHNNTYVTSQSDSTFDLFEQCLEACGDNYSVIHMGKAKIRANSNKQQHLLLKCISHAFLFSSSHGPLRFILQILCLDPRMKPLTYSKLSENIFFSSDVLLLHNVMTKCYVI